MSNPLPYDITSPQSILEYARGLSGKTLEEAVDLSGFIENIKNKGDLGVLVEKYYFRHVPQNNHDPDFKEAGVELKTTGVRKDKSGKYRAKERLVLTSINYAKLAEEDWDTSSLMHKCALLLLLFYYYEKIPKDGKAHELSEGDTFYLGACRKGSGGEKEPLKAQPYSPIGAKARAFSFKPSYINTILDNHAQPSIIKNTKDAHIGIEALVSSKFSPYIGKTIDEISEILSFYKQGKNDKGFGKSLVMRMLGTTKRTLPEFEKAGVETKIITLNRSGTPTEYISFPTFDYMKIVDENWEESSFSEKLESKFLFVVFETDSDKKVRLHKAVFWNMPYEDREEARRVWELTKQRVLNGQAENLPKISESPVAHVRPHGANNTTALFPTPQGKPMPRMGFWLNKSYVAEQINNI
ncbi:hypothetical protein B7Z00_00020 [Candidatus Saccharibacteria bacterium 32-50-10]|nr:MAG: hypothetical protein B7Z00_00020 [Candidatus Saccharibacteria bacterium 32-50-10]